MKKSRYYVFPAVCAAVSLICFAFVYYAIVTGTVFPFVVGFIFILPSLIFGIIAILGYTGCINATASHVTTAVLIPVLAIASVFAFLIVAFVASTTTSIDPRQYSRVYGMYYSEDDEVNVFPEEIPEDAEDVEFVYYPSFLQGAGKIYLKYSDDAPDIKAIGKKLAEDAVWWGDFEEFHEWEDYPSYFGDPDYFFHEETALPEDTVIYLMEFENAYAPDEDEYEWWNHGTYTVVAISPDNSEIIYKSTWW